MAAKKKLSREIYNAIGERQLASPAFQVRRGRRPAPTFRRCARHAALGSSRPTAAAVLLAGSGPRHPTPNHRLQEWFDAHKRWLVPYTAFCFLRDLFGTAEHWRWGAMATPTPELLERLTGGAGSVLRAVF
jgi:hypothetical protein